MVSAFVAVVVVDRIAGIPFGGPVVFIIFCASVGMVVSDRFSKKSRDSALGLGLGLVIVIIAVALVSKTVAEVARL